MNNPDYNWKAALGPTDECAPIEDLVMLLEGRGGNERKAKAHAHVAACAHCQSELALLNTFQQPGVNDDERHAIDSIVADLRANSPARKRESWGRRFFTARFLIPATVALAAGVTMLSVVLPSRRSAEISFTPGGEVMRSQTIAVLDPVGDVVQAPKELRWQPVKAVKNYKVRLLEVDRTSLWSGSTNVPAASLPDSVRLNIAPNRTLTWEVEGYDSAGNKIASSGLQRFRVRGLGQP